MSKAVYTFGGGVAEGDGSMRAVLGAKGATLAEMTKLGVPVPPGFTIATEVCATYYRNNEALTPAVQKEVQSALTALEERQGLQLGDRQKPLLLAVRSGAAAESIPGITPTILNLGLNDETVQGLIASAGNERFGWDAYRRFLHMYGNCVKSIPETVYQKALADFMREVSARTEADFNAFNLRVLCDRFKALYRQHTREEFPQDARTQLTGAIEAMFRSWMSEDAQHYRKVHQLYSMRGTAVTVQAMVFGNMGAQSAVGVAYTRDPETGDNRMTGMFVENAQGDDVAQEHDGRKRPIDELAKFAPEAHRQLLGARTALERHYRNMQEMEFTVQQGRLYMLETHAGRRSGRVALKIALDMLDEGLLNEEQAILRVRPSNLEKILYPQFDRHAEKKLLAAGIAAARGAACGQVVFFSEDAEALAQQGVPSILVRHETSPEDIGGISLAQGIVTATGGIASHAPVVARASGKPCVAGASDIQIDYLLKEMRVGDTVVKQLDWIAIDGEKGHVYLGKIPVVKYTQDAVYDRFMKLVDKYREMKVYANADTPADAAAAKRFGAEGIGLCRTEHMFFDVKEIARIFAMRKLILATNEEQRKVALAEIFPFQRKDFIAIFREMGGMPVTVRLFDPPLHEFLPKGIRSATKMARAMQVPIEVIQRRMETLKEFNPMLGHRGCRLAITYPGIYRMQARAIAEAACIVRKEGIVTRPEIMIPLVSTREELATLRAQLSRVIQRVLEELGESFEIPIGTMIETPRACLAAGDIAQEADFFSIGTNDLTQFGFGFSRDDCWNFLNEYIQQGIMTENPFETLDVRGLGELVRSAIRKGRSEKRDLVIGISGEHGGDPRSVQFFYEAGVDYVSCSPFRIPIARLVAAQSAIVDPSHSDAVLSAATMMD